MGRRSQTAEAAVVVYPTLQIYNVGRHLGAQACGAPRCGNIGDRRGLVDQALETTRGDTPYRASR